jgi:molybdate transport system permease protein
MSEIVWVGSRERPRAAEGRRGGFYGWVLLSLPMLAFLTLPLLALLLRTPPANLLANLSKPAVLQAISLSVQTSLVSTSLTVLMGTPVAYLLARRRFALHRVIDTLVDLPVVLPPAVAGVALLMAFGKRGLVGGLLADLGITIAFTTIAVIMAQIFISAPFFIRSAVVGFSAIESELEQAAAIDGANAWQVFRLMTVPLSWTALLSGAVMAWARALGEFGATIIFAGNFPGRTQTMPLAIYMGFEVNLDIALTLSVLLVGCSFAVLMLVKALFRSREEPVRD